MRTTYHIEPGTARPGELRAIVRLCPHDSAYLTRRGRYRGGEEVYRLIVTSTRRDGHRSADSLAFRNPLHARAWLGILAASQQRRKARTA